MLLKCFENAFKIENYRKLSIIKLEIIVIDKNNLLSNSQRPTLIMTLEIIVIEKTFLNCLLSNFFGL
jgi:hypothetical protein